MELTVIISTLCLCFFILLTPCAATMQIQEQEHPSPSKQAREEIMFSLPKVLLPRKLRLLEEVAVQDGYSRPAGSTTSHEKQKGDLSGKSQHKKKEENAMQGSKSGAGTWHEWMEGKDASQFFTMDYSHVRRRRPIHNKSLPVGP